MPGLILPSQWRQQPQGSVRIDRNNPITAGLVFAAIPIGATFFDVVGGQAHPAVFSTRPRQTVDGNLSAAVSLIGSTGTAAAFTNQTGLDRIAGQFSLFAEASLEASDFRQIVQTFDTSVGNGITLSLDNTFAQFNSIGLGINKDYDASSTNVLGTNSYLYTHRVGATADGANIKFYAKGQLTNTVANTKIPTSDANRRTYLLGNQGGRHASSAALVLAWDRVLGLREYQALYVNPWQLFQAPTRRIWVASAGAPAGTTVDPAVGTVALTGYAPTVAQSANQSATPAAGSLAITGYAPTIAQPHAANPGVGSLAITGYAPTVTQAVNQAVNPGVGTISITGYAPSIAQSANHLITANAGSVALTGYAPSVAQSAHQAITPNVGALTITGYAPSIVQESASRTILPGVGSLTITGYAPVVAQSGGQDGFGGVPFFQSEQANKYRRKKAKEEEQPAVEVKPAVESAAQSVIVKVAKKVDLTEATAKATRELKAELKRQEIAYEKLYAKQLEEQRNALLIQELQDLIQQDLEEQDEEEAMLLLM